MDLQNSNDKQINKLWKQKTLTGGGDPIVEQATNGIMENAKKLEDNVRNNKMNALMVIGRIEDGENVKNLVGLMGSIISLSATLANYMTENEDLAKIVLMASMAYNEFTTIKEEKENGKEG